MVVATGTVEKQTIVLDFIDIIVHDGQADLGLKGTTRWYLRLHAVCFFCLRMLSSWCLGGIRHPLLVGFGYVGTATT